VLRQSRKCAGHRVQWCKHYFTAETFLLELSMTIDQSLTKTLVASLRFVYYDRLAISFEATLAERLTNDARSHSALLCVMSFGQEGRQQQAPVQQPNTSPQDDAFASGLASAQQRGPQERPTPPAEEPPVVTKHEIRAGGKTLRYTATSG